MVNMQTSCVNFANLIWRCAKLKSITIIGYPMPTPAAVSYLSRRGTVDPNRPACYLHPSNVHLPHRRTPQHTGPAPPQPHPASSRVPPRLLFPSLKGHQPSKDCTWWGEGRGRDPTRPHRPRVGGMILSALPPTPVARRGFCDSLWRGGGGDLLMC